MFSICEIFQKLNPDKQHPLVLGEHLKTTVTEPLEVPHLGFCVGDSGCYENSLSSHKTFNAFCWLSKKLNL